MNTPAVSAPPNGQTRTAVASPESLLAWPAPNAELTGRRRMGGLAVRPMMNQGGRTAKLASRWRSSRLARARKSAKSKAAPVTKPKGDVAKALKVIPKRAGFRRAGYAFPDGETVIPLDELTDKQYEQLTNEPMLVTILIDAPAEPSDEKAE